MFWVIRLSIFCLFFCCFFRTWAKSLHLLLTCRVFDQRSTVFRELYFLKVILYSPLACFRILSLCFILESLTIMCSGEDLFQSCSLRVQHASLSFSKSGKMSIISLWVSPSFSFSLYLYLHLYFSHMYLVIDTYLYPYLVM